MTTPAVPPQAIEAAAVALSKRPGGLRIDYARSLARTALTAAAPRILAAAVAAERERIRQMALLRRAFYEDAAGYWDFADLIGGDST
jgi:hypothetical protein